MSQRYTFSEGPSIFESSNTIILKVDTPSDAKPLLAKVSAKSPPDEFTIESFKRDFQFTQTLHQKYPDCFLNMLKLVEEENSIYIIEEADGDALQVYLSKKGSLGIKEFLEKSIFMCRALYNLHSCNVIHRDIKTGNFVLSEKSKQPKLIDFGISTFVSKKQPSVNCTIPIGTYSYMR
eukprot:gene10308-2725_t